MPICAHALHALSFIHVCMSTFSMLFSQAHSLRTSDSYIMEGGLSEAAINVLICAIHNANCIFFHTTKQNRVSVKFLDDIHVFQFPQDGKAIFQVMLGLRQVAKDTNFM